MSGNSWSQMLSNGTVSIDSTRAYRGDSSLKSHINGGAAMSSPCAIIGTETSRSPSSASSTRGSGSTSRRRCRRASSSSSISPTPAPPASPSPPTPARSRSTTTPAPDLPAVDDEAAARPLGLHRFVMSQGSTTGAIQISLDGKHARRPPRRPAPRRPPSACSSASTSTPTPAPIGAYDAWFDELIVDNKPIACTD